MSKTLEPSAWSRVRDLEVKLGPVGATLNFDAGARAEDVIVLVTEVERAIRQRFGVHELDDPRLRVGHWFQVTDGGSRSADRRTTCSTEVSPAARRRTGVVTTADPPVVIGTPLYVAFHAPE